MPWAQLASRLSSLPLVVSGPILRRTEPGAVTVWLALRDARTVTLRVYSDGGEQRLHGTRRTVRVGDHLHIVAVTANNFAPGAGPLVRGAIYTYDVFFSPAEVSVVPEAAPSLGTDAVLGAVGATALAQLVYAPLPRPSFSTCPSALSDLRVVHGSCRKPHAPGTDALTALDGMIAAAPDEPCDRPHQLFLTGDQIYADDVGEALLVLLTDAGNTLLGWTELLPVGVGITLPPAAPELLPGARQALLLEKAGFTSSEAGSHLMSLAEFCAMYLFVWSDVLWPLELPSFVDVFPIEAQEHEDDKEADQTLLGLWPRKRLHSEHKTTFETHVDHLNEFRGGLPKVRRALANVPVYMMFDDHEVTDDWYLNRAWCEGVFETTLGPRVIANALAAYGLFQAWGNTPAAFDSYPGRDLLDQLAAYAAAGGAAASRAALDAAVGVPAQVIFQDDQLPVPPIRWHYQVPGERHEVVVLDTRTMRRYVGDRLDSPELLSPSALSAQLTSLPQCLNAHEVTLVVSPAPVVGVRLVEGIQSAITGSARLRLWLGDTFEPLADAPVFRRVGRWLKSADLYYADPEAWSARESLVQTLFAILVRRNPQTLILSGDVHYGFAARVDYWGRTSFRQTAEPTPASGVIGQLTASAFRNQDSLTDTLHHVGFFEIDREHLWAGWNDPVPVVQLTIGPATIEIQPNGDFSILRENGLRPIGLVARAPDWRFRVRFLQAEPLHPDDSEIEKLRLAPPILVEPPGDAASRGEALRQYLAGLRQHRHWGMVGSCGREVVGVNNIGEITFQDSDGVSGPRAIQALWWVLEDAKKMLPLTRCEIELTAEEEPPPLPLGP